MFLAEAKRSSRYYVLYLTAVMTGMRQGELGGLRWQDLDLTTATASVQRSLVRIGKDFYFKDPKTRGGRRSVSLPPIVVDELKHLRQSQSEIRRQLGAHYEDCDLVFCQTQGRPLRANNVVRRDFKRIVMRVGLPTIRFHDLRHVHATLLLKSGVNPKVVQERLGHSTPAFTLHVYSHVLPGMQEQAAQALERSLLVQEPQ